MQIGPRSSNELADESNENQGECSPSYTLGVLPFTPSFCAMLTSGSSIFHWRAIFDYAAGARISRCLRERPEEKENDADNIQAQPEKVD